ncbi:MAG: HAD family hydrolase [Alphaproteobacteria bacterium]|nr:HAD family hydrolase [Alphaproteobacteria bacterium]
MSVALPIAEPGLPTDPGLWHQVLRHNNARGGARPALFLDRDGVIVDEVDYLHRVADVRLIDGAAETIRACNQANLPVVIVTNQSGVGRGYYGWEDFAAVQAHLLGLLDAAGARVDMVLACAYHGDAQPPYAVADHPWRKPNPGMLLAAADALDIDLTRSWIVGDTASDLMAGAAAGLAGGVHVLTGHGAREREKVMGLKPRNYDLRTARTVGSLQPEFLNYLHVHRQ